MKGETAVYLGNIIPKAHFRAFIYNVSGEKKLIDGWGNFEAHMATGIWFAKEEEAKSIKNEMELSEKPKRKRKSKAVGDDSGEEEPMVPDDYDGMAVVLNDEFLSEAKD